MRKRDDIEFTRRMRALLIISVASILTAVACTVIGLVDHRLAELLRLVSGIHMIIWRIKFDWRAEYARCFEQREMMIINRLMMVKATIASFLVSPRASRKSSSTLGLCYV